MLDKDTIYTNLAAYWNRTDDDIGEWRFNDRAEYTDVIDGASVKVIDTKGGEDEGSYAHIVWRITWTDGTTSYFKMYGSYASYEGFFWDGPFVEVAPLERTVTIYEETM